MSLGNYATASNGLARELEDSLNTEEVAALAKALHGVSLHGWRSWCEKYAHDIESYVEATPSSRTKKKRWNTDPVLRAQLALGAIHHARHAQALLRCLSEYGALLAVGGSYRDTTSSAGRACKALLRSDIPVWPESWQSVAPYPFAD